MPLNVQWRTWRLCNFLSNVQHDIEKCFCCSCRGEVLRHATRSEQLATICAEKAWRNSLLARWCTRIKCPLAEMSHGDISAQSKAWDRMPPSWMKCPPTMPWLRNGDSSQISVKHMATYFLKTAHRISKHQKLSCRFHAVGRVPSRGSRAVILVQFKANVPRTFHPRIKCLGEIPVSSRKIALQVAGGLLHCATAVASCYDCCEQQYWILLRATFRAT